MLMGEKIDIESPAVQSYLGILQNVITRMASNSTSCKTWCITIVSAILVVVANKSKPDYALIALIPIILFTLLDSYYLGMERGFRDSYNSFIKKLHANNATIEDIFIVSPGGGGKHITYMAVKSMLSFSIWLFYGVLAVMLYATREWVL